MPDERSPNPANRMVGGVQRRHWDGDAERYHGDHADYLDTFHWCPERLTEADARLLGEPEELAGRTIVEVGCGSAPCACWLARNTGAHVIGLDVSMRMLQRAPSGTGVSLLQADAAELPLATGSVDRLFSSFGAYPFIADLPAALSEVSRVLSPGGRAVLAVNHPSAWIFPDDPDSVAAEIPYFQDAYLEFDGDDGEVSVDGAAGQLRYAEFHHTMGDWVRAVATSGLALVDLVEPEWTPGTPDWGQWSQRRGELFPGTAIFILSPVGR
ncbi:MAG TPA: class I SAM-dependent methyltransferase [Candidatus Corynebacterium avicola]|uniref:Class I SAM-dependent methyltransferase n=1 Tax=Candidatus Corynebacterium avicola TaxID=2838527 RepID=A0A9D1UL25_9CORY|nr:class I SAM-dependent methyltransferase [Candidatus Corynebacterium avicola]